MSPSQRLNNSVQGLAMAGMLFSPQLNGYALLRPETAASMAWKSDALLPSTSVTLTTSSSAVEAVDEALGTLSMAALANNVFADSRPLEDWEKQATDDFYLSHFR